MVPSPGSSVPSSLSISAVTARYPFDRLEDVVGKESCIVNTSGIVSGSGSGSGSASRSEIEGVGARETGCVEKELVVEIEMKVEEWDSWKNER